MSFQDTYDTGTLVTYYHGKPGEKARTSPGIVVAGPLSTPFAKGLVRLTRAMGKTGTWDTVIQLLGSAIFPGDSDECVVPVRPDGIEVGTLVWLSMWQRDISGHIAAGPLTEQQSAMFDRLILRAGGLAGQAFMPFNSARSRRIH